VVKNTKKVLLRLIMSMKEKIRNYFRGKPIRWITDLVLVLLVVLLLIPATRSVFLSGFAWVRTGLSPVPSVPADRVELSEAVWQMRFLDGDGVEFQLSDYRGQVIFFHQWATWCPGCRAEMAGLQRLYDEERDRVVFILLTNESRAVVEAYLARSGYRLPISYGRVTVPELSTRTIPATAVIGASGKVEVWREGVYDWGSKKVRRKLGELVDLSTRPI
jgi:thiol-disulfide isomerase/thioredoxin